MHGLAVYVKEVISFEQDLSLENASDFCLYSTGFTSFYVLFFFPFIDHLLCLYAQFLMTFHITWMRFCQSTYLIGLSLET